MQFRASNHTPPVETERGLVLIDVGPEGLADALEVHLADLGYGLEDIWLVTPIHHDETTSAGPKWSVHAPIQRSPPMEETAFPTGEGEPRNAIHAPTTIMMS
jgi:hypothetical protein